MKAPVLSTQCNKCLPKILPFVSQYGNCKSIDWLARVQLHCTQQLWVPLEHESNCLALSSAEVKNAWSITSMSLYTI